MPRASLSSLTGAHRALLAQVVPLQLQSGALPATPSNEATVAELVARGVLVQVRGGGYRVAHPVFHAVRFLIVGA